MALPVLTAPLSAKATFHVSLQRALMLSVKIRSAFLRNPVHGP